MEMKNSCIADKICGVDARVMEDRKRRRDGKE